MAVVTYIGKQIARAWKKTLTVTTSDPTSTITFSGGGGQTCVLTPTSATNATTAGEIANALSQAGGVFQEFTYEVSAAVVTITGPADGAIVTFSVANGGTNAQTLAVVFAPLSPHDAADVLNYSTGALPVDTVDSLVLEDSDVSIKYNLTALAALELAAPGLIRRESYTGQVGLPTTNPLGFPEYRATELSAKSATYFIEAGDRDTANQIRLLNTFSASAVTVTIQGSQSNAQVGDEAIYIRGLPASSVITTVGGSLCISPNQGQACTVLTLTALDSTIRIGASATLSGTLTLVNCNSQIKSSWTTGLTMDGGTCEIAGSAAGVVVIEAGTMNWRSTGSVGAAPVLGSGSVFDLSQAPAAGVAAVTFNMYAGSTLNDPAGRGGNWAFKTVHCTLGEVVIVTKNDATYTKS